MKTTISVILFSLLSICFCFSQPTINCPGNQVRNTNTGVCTYTSAGTEFNPLSFTGNGATIVFSLSGVTAGSGSNLSGVMFNKGISTVKWTVTDNVMNSATCSFVVTVNDNENPTITCIINQTRSPNTGVCAYTTVGTEFDPANFADNCPGPTTFYYLTGATTGVGSNTISGGVLHNGITTVTWEVTDASGNIASCGFTVTVHDTVNPTIICPGNQVRCVNFGPTTYQATGTEFSAISFGDNCPGATISYTLSGVTTGSGLNTLAGVNFNLGITAVVWKVTDAGGNTATCTFNVSIAACTIISGNIFWDTNLNGILDTGEHTISGKMVELINDSTFYTTQSNGSFAFGLDTGTYQLKCIPLNYCKFTTDSIITIIVTDTSTHIDNVNFGVMMPNNISDISVDITGNPPNVHWPVKYWLTYKNEASLIQSGDITLKIGTHTTFASSEPPPDSQNGNIITWNYTNLASLEQQQIQLYLNMPGIHTGDTLTGIAFIDPVAGDIVPSNNYDTLKCIIVGPVDPNDKLVDKGVGPQGYTKMGEELEYTIRFQNTGTAPAGLVQIIDTLDKSMDMESLRIISSSDSVRLDAEGKNIVTVIFENIQLPDSNVDEPGSHGFVKFAVKPKAGLADSTIVTNKAYIYFDYNPAVPTNRTINTYVNGTAGLSKAATEAGIFIYPNPATNKITITCSTQRVCLISISDIQGKLLMQQHMVQKKTDIDISRLAKGLYFVRIENEQSVVVKKFVKE